MPLIDILLKIANKEFASELAKDKEEKDKEEKNKKNAELKKENIKPSTTSQMKITPKQEWENASY